MAPATVSPSVDSGISVVPDSPWCGGPEDGEVGWASDLNSSKRDGVGGGGGGLKRPHGHADGRWSPASPASSLSSSFTNSSGSTTSSNDSFRPPHTQWHGKQQHVPTMDMEMEFWVRSEECKALKSDHLDYIDSHYSSREQFIEDTVFTDPATGEVHDTVLEPNMFPYSTPSDVEHWTLWSRSDMSHEQVQEWVTKWLMQHMPHVRRWNYDDNAGDRSIYWFHVHVYLQFDDPAFARPRLTGHEVERDALARSRYVGSRRRSRHHHRHHKGGRSSGGHGSSSGSSSIYSQEWRGSRSRAPSPSSKRQRRRYDGGDGAAVSGAGAASTVSLDCQPTSFTQAQ